MHGAVPNDRQHSRLTLEPLQGFKCCHRYPKAPHERLLLQPRLRRPTRQPEPALPPRAVGRAGHQHHHVRRRAGRWPAGRIGVAAGRRRGLLWRRGQLRHLAARARHGADLARARRPLQGPDHGRLRRLRARPRRRVGRFRHRTRAGDDGRHRRPGTAGQCVGRRDALRVARGRRQHALGLAVQPQRCDRQPGGDGRRAGGLRHRQRLARPRRCRGHGRPGADRRALGHPAGVGRASPRACARARGATPCPTPCTPC